MAFNEKQTDLKAGLSRGIDLQIPALLYWKKSQPNGANREC